MGARSTLTPTLSGLLHNTNAATVRNTLLQWSLHDVATALAGLQAADQVAVLALLPLRAAAAVFEYLPATAQRALMSSLSRDEFAALVNVMAPDDRTLFLSELPQHATDELLLLLDGEQRQMAQRLLAFPPGSVGRLLTPHYVAVRADWTVQAVFDHVRTHGQNSETLDVLYVIDDAGRLIDDIRVRDLLVAPIATPIAMLINGHMKALRATDDQRAAIEVFRREDRTALPVVDAEGMLIGIVTIDDVLDTAQELATRDLQRFGGNEALDEPYMSMPVPRMVRKRAGWLVILFMGELLTATAMGFFAHEIAQAVVLAMFIPLIISSGGNSGSQASTLVIRALALGEVRLADWWRVAQRELFAGLSLGGLLGSIGFARIALWSLFTTMYGPHWMLIALTVGVALAGVVLWGALIGAMLPFLLRRAGFDPATASAPFVATLVDVTGLLIYFSAGVAILRGTLL
jgi:magnesium transporter